MPHLINTTPFSLDSLFADPIVPATPTDILGDITSIPVQTVTSPQTKLEENLKALETAMNVPLPSQSAPNQAFLASVMPAQQAAIARVTALAETGSGKLNSVLDSADRAKEGNTALYDAAAEQALLDEATATEVAKRTEESRAAASNINSASNMTLYQQAQQNARIESQELTEYNKIINDPDAGFLSKFAASFKRFAFGAEQPNSSHNTLARVQQQRNAAVLDHINTVTQVQSDVRAQNIEQYAALQRRKETATALVTMSLDNISVDSKSLSAIGQQMGLEQASTTELAKGLNSLKALDQFTIDNVQNLLMQAQVKTADARMRKELKSSVDEEEFFKREEAYWSEFSQTSNDPNMANKSVKEFFKDSEQIRDKTGKLPDAMNRYLLYRDNKSLPSVAPVSDYLRRDAAGTVDPNNPNSYTQTDKMVDYFIDKTIQEFNGAQADITKFIDRNTLTEAQIKDLDKKVAFKMSTLNRDITPLLQSNAVQFHDINALRKASQASTPEGAKLRETMESLFLPEELAAIDAGEMDKITTALAPDNPAGGVQGIVSTAMQQIMALPSRDERAKKMAVYASIIAKNMEAQRRLALGQGAIGLGNGATILGVKDFSTGKPMQGKGEFRLDSEAAWLSLMKDYELDKSMTLDLKAAVRQRF